jgi:hypothetical protein
VCLLVDAKVPHRIGRGAHHVRRFALFTLVGIAGADDLDAPDRNARPHGAGAPNGGETGQAIWMIDSLR